MCLKGTFTDLYISLFLQIKQTFLVVYDLFGSTMNPMQSVVPDIRR